MKFLSIGVVAAVFAAGACNRADTAATPSAGSGAGGPTASSWRQVTIPAGTQLPIVLETTVASNTSHVEEPVQARLSRAVLVHGVTALPEGSRVSGVVIDAKESGRVKGRAHVAIRFDSIVPRGEDERYTMRSAAVGRTAQGHQEERCARNRRASCRRRSDRRARRREERRARRHRRRRRRRHGVRAVDARSGSSARQRRAHHAQARRTTHRQDTVVARGFSRAPMR